VPNVSDPSNSPRERLRKQVADTSRAPWIAVASLVVIALVGLSAVHFTDVKSPPQVVPVAAGELVIPQGSDLAELLGDCLNVAGADQRRPVFEFGDDRGVRDRDYFYSCVTVQVEGAGRSSEGLAAAQRLITDLASLDARYAADRCHNDAAYLGQVYAQLLGAQETTKLPYLCAGGTWHGAATLAGLGQDERAQMLQAWSARCAELDEALPEVVRYDCANTVGQAIGMGDVSSIPAALAQCDDWVTSENLKGCADGVMAATGVRRNAQVEAQITQAGGFPVPRDAPLRAFRAISWADLGPAFADRAAISTWCQSVTSAPVRQSCWEHIAQMWRLADMTLPERADLCGQLPASDAQACARGVGWDLNPAAQTMGELSGSAAQCAQFDESQLRQWCQVGLLRDLVPGLVLGNVVSDVCSAMLRSDAAFCLGWERRLREQELSVSKLLELPEGLRPTRSWA
jgi:hypothetical protein